MAVLVVPHTEGVENVLGKLRDWFASPRATVKVMLSLTYAMAALIVAVWVVASVRA